MAMRQKTKLHVWVIVVVLFHDSNDAKTGKAISDHIASAFEHHMLWND
jgi:hypothetical protein